jgi:NAD(P)H dehydrogenase (quinone)
VIAPVRPRFNLDRYDRELRCPFPSEPQFAPESKVWRREHGDAKRNVSIAEVRTLRA